MINPTTVNVINAISYNRHNLFIGVSFGTIIPHYFDHYKREFSGPWS